MRNLIHELVTHYADLRRQLTRELRDPHYAADIAQTSFERVYTQVLEAHAGMPADAAASTSGRGIESPKAMLFKVARNLCIDEARKKKVASEWAGSQSAMELHTAVPSSEYLVAQKQMLEKVIKTLESLPPLRREVFILSRAHGYTRAEIAAQLNISEVAVAKHLVRAAIDCSRVFADLRSDLIEQPTVYNHAGFDASLAEDFF